MLGSADSAKGTDHLSQVTIFYGSTLDPNVGDLRLINISNFDYMAKLKTKSDFFLLGSTILYPTEIFNL